MLGSKSHMHGQRDLWTEWEDNGPGMRDGSRHSIIKDPPHVWTSTPSLQRQKQHGAGSVRSTEPGERLLSLDTNATSYVNSHFRPSASQFWCKGTESQSFKVLQQIIAQLCTTLCNPMDCSPPGSSVCGIFKARIPEWVAIPFFRWSSWPKDRTWSPADSLPRSSQKSLHSVILMLISQRVLLRIKWRCI